LRIMGGAPSNLRWRRVVRVLGARHLAEAALERGGRTDRVRVAALVDTVHAASVIGFAALDRPRRRVALVDACVAGSFAAYGWRIAEAPSP
jgi:hypothetical protein